MSRDTAPTRAPSEVPTEIVDESSSSNDDAPSLKRAPHHPPLTYQLPAALVPAATELLHAPSSHHEAPLGQSASLLVPETQVQSSTMPVSSVSGSGVVHASSEASTVPVVPGDLLPVAPSHIVTTVGEARTEFGS